MHSSFQAGKLEKVLIKVTNRCKIMTLIHKEEAVYVSLQVRGCHTIPMCIINATGPCLLLFNTVQEDECVWMFKSCQLCKGQYTAPTLRQIRSDYLPTGVLPSMNSEPVMSFVTQHCRLPKFPRVCCPQVIFFLHITTFSFVTHYPKHVEPVHGCSRCSGNHWLRFQLQTVLLTQEPFLSDCPAIQPPPRE